MKDKDQIQQEEQIVQGEEYREKYPSKIMKKNKELKSLRGKLVTALKKLEDWQKFKNGGNHGGWVDSCIHSWKKTIKKLEERIKKLENK